MRKRGSVRFEPYYKVQVWDARSYAWSDVQRQYESEQEAREAFPAGATCRVMEVTTEGRHPLP